jgi:transcriptional regulator with XRE-family HTH domain
VPEDAKRLKSQVARRIRARREELAMTREKLAEAMGVTHQYVAKCELGKQNLGLESLVKFANALDTTVLSLLENEPK